MGPTLSPAIGQAFAHKRICAFLTRTLAEDFRTFGVPEPAQLAYLTMDMLRDAGSAYPDTAKRLALEVYPTWQGRSVRDLYHEYNWHVERAGSAEIAAQYLTGTTHVDIGGGPGTFALEVLQQKSTPWQVTVADIGNYLNPTAKDHPHIRFQPLTPDGSIPFVPRSFDSGSLLYVLHHVEQEHGDFLRAWAQCIRQTLVLFEDVKIDPTHGIPPRSIKRPVRALEADFVQLSLEEQHLYMAGIDYVCNHIASQALTMLVPAKYYEFHELTRFLGNIFPTATVTAHYHGMYDGKCYPNPEAMYVVQFADQT